MTLPCDLCHDRPPANRWTTIRISTPDGDILAYRLCPRCFALLDNVLEPWVDNATTFAATEAALKLISLGHCGN